MVANPQDNWNGMNGISGETLGVAGGLSFDTQTNSLSVQLLIQSAQHVDFTFVENMVDFPVVF